MWDDGSVAYVDDTTSMNCVEIESSQMVRYMHGADAVKICV